MMGEEQSPVMNHRVTNVVSGVGMGGFGGIARMRNSHSSQDVASITNEQDYWAYGPGIVDRLKSKFINLSLNQTQAGAAVLTAASKRSNLRTCTSLENLQDNNPPYKPSPVNSTHKLLMTSPANMRDPKKFVPKSPSMEVLLDSTRNHGPPTIRCVVSSSISSVVESELPRRDTVRKYKTFFEQSSSPQHQSSSVSPPAKPAGILKTKTSPVKKPVANIKPLLKEPEPERRDSPPLSKTKEVTQAVQEAVLNEINLQSNGYQDIMSIGCTVETKVSTPIVPRTTSVVVKPRACPLLLSESNSRPQPVSAASSMGSSMVFDFRGKDVKPQVAVMPSPIRISREELDGTLEDSTEPCGITFIGENVVVGRGSLISTRNKNLSIRFDDDNLSSMFEYEAEDDDTEPDDDDVTANHSGLPSAALGNYKPNVLDEDDFQLGVSRLRREQLLLTESSTPADVEAEPVKDEFRPASQDETSTYSQVGSSDLLF